MKNNHYIMRCMRKNLREDEKKANDTFCESNNLFNRLVKKVVDTKSTPQPLHYKKIAETEKVVQKHSEAAEKAARASSSAWMKKRGNIEEFRNSNINRIVFKMLDPEDRGEINLDTLVKFLTELGLLMHPQKLKDVICITLRKDPARVRLKYEDLCNLCKADRQVKVTTRRINEQVKKDRLKSEANRTDLISIGEEINVIEEWWKSLDAFSRNQVQVSSIAEFLVEKNIAGDLHEGRRQIQEIASENQYLDKDHFFAIFGKVLIRWILIHIQQRFSEEDWKNTDRSPSLKFTCLKRNLIMAGIKCPRSGVSQDEGTLVINAIEKYRRFSNDVSPKLTYKDFLEDWGERLVASQEQQRTKNKLQVETIRPFSVPSVRHDAENIFYGEFQKFVNS